MLRFPIPVVLLAILAFVSLSGRPGPEFQPGPPAMTGETSHTSPRMTVLDASPAQITRLGEAFEAFRDAGLELPDLEIGFFPDETSCGGSHGRFGASEDVWRIRICSTEMDSVYEHELAHAWELANVTDRQREEFMSLRQYSNWADRDRPWRERGVEGAALVIQQGVAGLPLPPALGREAISRLEAFELLTELPAPTLIDWIQTREVPCHRRPTPMSATLSDETGLICEERVEPATN